MRQVTKKTLNIRGELLVLDKPVVMGILNRTPDSFFSSSRIHEKTLGEINDLAGKMLEEGATMLDIGGYSTRPGARSVSEQEESDRVLPVVEALVRAYPKAVLSVDTFRAEVARRAVGAGAAIVNDVSGGTLDPEMVTTVAELGVPYVLMHMRGTPDTMNTLTTYERLAVDILKDLQQKLSELRKQGVADVIIDPGFGFAKTAVQNFELLRELELFHMLDCPLLVGISRKRMIWQSLGITADAALNGTTVLNTIALWQGAAIVRVHDVKEAREAVVLVEALRNG